MYLLDISSIIKNNKDIRLVFIQKYRHGFVVSVIILLTVKIMTVKVGKIVNLRDVSNTTQHKTYLKDINVKI